MTSLYQHVKHFTIPEAWMSEDVQITDLPYVIKSGYSNDPRAGLRHTCPLQASSTIIPDSVDEQGCCCFSAHPAGNN
ncbi:MAG: hypothetical protein LBE22_04290 [Azoarcus sp.]|jgi:hypothetical protein|nr:hypothetical protein [Azoarcus sp.]